MSIRGAVFGSPDTNVCFGVAVCVRGVRRAELYSINQIVPVRVVHGKDLIDVIAGHRTGMSTTTIEACKKVLQDIIHERMSLNE